MVAAPLRRLSRDDPEVEGALVARVAADAPDEDVVAARRLDRHRVARRRGIVDDGDTGRRLKQLAGPLRGERPLVSTLTASEWPVTTGTRTQVAVTLIS